VAAVDWLVVLRDTTDKAQLAVSRSASGRVSEL